MTSCTGADQMRNYGNHLHENAGPATQQRNKHSYKRGFSHEKALIYGVVQCLTGIAFLVLGVVSVASRAWGYRYGCGVWCGLLSLTGGIVGLAASRRKTNKTIITFMILSVMSATSALITVSIASVGIVADHSLYDEVQMSNYSSAFIVHSLTIVVAIVAAFCGAMAAIVGCRGVCSAWYGTDEMPPEPVNNTHARPNSNDLNCLPQSHMLNDSLDPALLSSQPDVMHNTHNRHLPLFGSGYQQIAVVPSSGGGGGNYPAFSDDMSGRMIIMPSSGPGNQAVSQIMYLLHPGAPCPQPGQPTVEGAENSYSSPPPSYSTLALDLSLSGEQQHLDPDHTSRSNSDHDNSSETPQNLSTYSYDISCPSDITNLILQDLCRLTNNQRINNSDAIRVTNIADRQSASHAGVHSNTEQCRRNDENFQLLEGETSFSSDWGNSLHQPDSINDLELPLLDASPQRYRPCQGGCTSGHSDEQL